MSAVHCVVVWEWQSVEDGHWVPHAPNVARTLERAHAKKLTRVVLADADPSLRGHYVNLRTLTQYADMPDGGTEECCVRRACYSVQSPGGRGVCWEWARHVTHHNNVEFEPMPMEAQCVLEELYSGGCGGGNGGGGGSTVMWSGWALCVSRGSAMRGGALRPLRRALRPPYPLVRPPPTQTTHHMTSSHAPPAPSVPPVPPARPHVDGRRPRIPQQHTGSSVHSVQSVHSVKSVHSVQSVQSVQSAPARSGARSVSPKERKPGLARQILHNLNIFSSNKSSGYTDTRAGGDGEWSAYERCDTQRDGGGSDRGGGGGDNARAHRRHSVDTVSTYLSHESKDSLQQQASVGSLLNCSGGSDDVFDTQPTQSVHQHQLAHEMQLVQIHDDTNHDTNHDQDEVFVDNQEDLVVEWCRVWTRCVRVAQWGAVCAACMCPLRGGATASEGGAGGATASEGALAVVALRRCHHMLHARCLQHQLTIRLRQRLPAKLHCQVCGMVYGDVGDGGDGAASGGDGAADGGDGGGDQPSGSMSWRLQNTPLPHYTVPTIVITYNIQSGRQCSVHPMPGAPYYAVGFPRHTLLPDDTLGRDVLCLLRAAWSAAKLFTITTSLTTGREHVVSWRICPPPPHCPQLYANCNAHTMLTQLKVTLQRLLH